MKKKLITLCFCAGILWASSPDKLTAGDGDRSGQLRFRIAQYNIRYAAKADETTGNGWDIRKIPLAQLITGHDFDIAGTQEGNARQLADLETLLPEYAFTAAPYGGDSGTTHNCATFYRKDRFDVLASGTFWFSETPDVPSIGWDATDRRICHWTKFREKTFGTEFYFFNAHFYWRDTTARQNSGPLMVQKVREIAGDAPAISMGDFNSLPSASQILAIRTLMSDAYDITQTPRTGPEGTGFPGGVFQGTPGGRIDYIFVSRHFSVSDYAVLTDTYADGRYPSDHLPVACTVSVKRDQR
ncbi:MAG: endonuclease/exonuclease/phosphatase family protein [Tannerella sp.]|jgi:endonuclease/exonuclease/phosphatase family metal-dependent hydrolase|nr:endonuclease/exonuclease/phosphatase family protein [Tannerella sp.]